MFPCFIESSNKFINITIYIAKRGNLMTKRSIGQFFASVFKLYKNIITKIINSILLTPVYIFGIGITSIIAKLAHRHFLESKNMNIKSFWAGYENIKDKKRYYRLF